jgi:hypothetical protein
VSRSPSLRAWLLPVAWLVALAAVRAGVLEERDPFWQVRAGMENLAGQPLSRPDSWSWDPVDSMFTQTSPAWNDALALGWRAAGFAGFFTVGFLSLLAYGLVSLALARRLGARPMPTLVGLMATLLLALPMLSPRATLVAQTLYLGGLLLADLARPRMVAAPPVLAAGGALVGGFLLAWAGSWIHLSWMLLAVAWWGSVLVLLLSTSSAARARIGLLAASLGAGLALGVIAGPYGLGAWELSRQVQAAVDGVVLEWLSPFSADLWARWLPAVLAGLAVSVVAGRWVVRGWGRRGRDPRLGLVGALLVLAVPAAVGGLFAIRFVGVCLLALTPVIALGATALADRAHARASAAQPTGVFRSARVRFWTGGRPWRVVLTLVLVLLSPLVLLAAAQLGRPRGEAEAADRLPGGCRLFSEPAGAGTVLLLRHDVRVWMDSRADYWGRDRNLDALQTLASGDPSRPGVAGATCAMLPDDGSLGTGTMATALDADPAWHRTWSGGGVTVWVRRPV